MKIYNQEELFEQIKIFLRDNMKDKKYVFADASVKRKDNWIEESDNNNKRYEILFSKDYEITLKIKGQ